MDKGCQKMVICLVKFGVDQDKAEELAQRYNAKRIQQVLKYTRSKKPARPSGFIIRALENNWNIPESDVAAQSEDKKDLLKDKTRKHFQYLEQALERAEQAGSGTEHIGAILSRSRNLEGGFQTCSV